jgi:hypothetical protein
MGVAKFCVPPIAAQVPTRDPLVNVDPSLQTIAPAFSPEKRRQVLVEQLELPRQ